MVANVEFDITTPSGEFNVFPPVASSEYSEEMKEYLAAIHSVRNNVPIQAARQEIEVLGDDRFREQARQDATAIVDAQFVESVRPAIEVSSLPDVMALEEQRLANQEIVRNSEAPEVIAETQSNPGEVWDMVSTRTAARTAALTKKLAEVGNTTELTLLSGLLDFVDIIASYPFDLLTGGGFRRADLAKEIQNLLSADITEEAFNTRLDEVIEEARDSGWFSEENGLFLLGQLQNIREGGIGTEALLDQSATVLDAFGIGSLAMRGLRGARSTTAIVSSLRGPEVGRQVLDSGLARPNTAQAASAGIPELTLPGYVRHPSSGVDPFAWSAPGLHAAQEVERTNWYLDTIRNFGFSQRISPEVFDTWAPKGLKVLNDDIDSRSVNNVLNMRVAPDNSGNIFGSILFGTKNGVPFKTKGNATKFQKQFGGELVPFAQGDKVRWAVEQTKNLSTEGLQKPLESWEIGNHFFGAWGATFLTIPQRLEAVAKRGEGVLGRVFTEISPRLRKTIKATPKADRENVEKIFWSLRDGDKLSSRRHALSLPEFRNEWAKYSNTPPSEAAERLYLEIQELNDALYFLKADRIFKDVVNEGYEVMPLRQLDKDGNAFDRNLLVKGAREDLDPDTLVYNPVSGVRAKVSELPRGQKVFEVSGGLDIGGERAIFITSESPNLRRVFHSDVLGYNPGGPRGYEFLNFALKQPRKEKFLDGVTRPMRPRTFMGTATRKQAEQAVEEVNRIFAKVRELAPVGSNASLATATDALRSLRADPNMLEAVRLNNNWNLNIEDVDDFIKFVEDYNLDPRVNVGMGHMDDAFAQADDAGNLVFGSRIGETNRDAFDSILNQPRNGPRQNDPLKGFGGVSAPTVSPIDMISNDFVRTTHERAFSAYNFQAVGGWLKGAEKYIINRDEIKNLPPRVAMGRAEFAANPSPEAIGYMRARDAINRTLGHVSEYEKKWNGFIERQMERIFDSGFNPGKKSLAAMQLSKRPLEALRGLAFNVKLGLFAFDQLIVQSSQVFNILAIAGPRRWLPAMASNMPLRLTMINTSEEFAKEVGRRAAPFIGMDADEFVRFSRFFKESGRGVIGSEVAELNTVNSVMAKGMVSKVTSAGRFFFDEGERIPRMTAMHVAWKEFAQKFPKLDPFDDFGTNWITSRQDILTASMTRASAATWQKGPLSVPLQFMSYTSRMAESIFSNRVLSKKERLQLATAQVALWGAAGTGVGGVVLDTWVTEGGLDLTPDEFTALRYGVLDWAIGASVGSDTAFGSRLAVGQGFWDKWEDYNEDGLFKVIGGPAGTTVVDFFDVGLQIMGDLARGQTNMVGADLKKFLRNFTGPNKAYNAWVIYSMGDYLSRNDSAVASGLSKSDALFHVLGAPLQEVSLSYTRMELFQNQDEYIKTHGQRMGEIARVMRKKLRDGDMEGAVDLGRRLTMMNAMLEPWQREKAKVFWQPDATSFMEDMINEGLRRRQDFLDVHRDKGE